MQINDTIRHLAEETFKGMRSHCYFDKEHAISKIETALRTLAPRPIETRSIDPDLTGQTLESICRQNNTILMGVPMTAHSLAHPPSYTLIATKFAVSITSSLQQEKKGKCVWTFDTRARHYTSGCYEGRGVASQLSPAAMCWKFCPHCGLEIEESKA